MSYCIIAEILAGEIRFVIYVAFNLYLSLVTRLSNVCVMGLKVKQTLLAKGRRTKLFLLCYIIQVSVFETPRRKIKLTAHLPKIY